VRLDGYQQILNGMWTNMSRNTLLALTISIAVSCLPALAQDGNPPQDSFTAQALKDACQPVAGLDKNARALADLTCGSYLRGLTEGLFLQTYIQSSGAATCIPQDSPISIDDAKTALLNYLTNNPDASSHEAGVAVVLGVVRAYACSGD
jgi:hypothetical protein